MQHSISIRVKGIVQGVYYRQSTREMATRHGITGEVKNLSNGDVHIFATGTSEQLETLINWCNKGPDTAVVADVIVEKIPLREFNAFRIVK